MVLLKQRAYEVVKIQAEDNKIS